MDAVINRCTLLIGGSALFAIAAITMSRRPDGFQAAIRYAAISWLFAIADTVEWMIDAQIDPLDSGAVYQRLLSAPLSLIIPLAMTGLISLLCRCPRVSWVRATFVVVLPCCIALVDLILLLWESAEVTAAAEVAAAFNLGVR